MLPAMVCMDGFILSHVFEPVILLEQELTDEFLPTYDPEHVLDTRNPLSFGTFADPSAYTEFRYLQQKGMDVALGKIEKAAEDFKTIFGRYYGGLIEPYMAEDAEILLMAMGSVVGTIKDVIDKARSQGIKVGLIKVRTFRPFPVEVIRSAVSDAAIVVTLDKNISVGLNEGALFTEVKSCLYNSDINVPVMGFMLGHGGLIQISMYL